jgi:C-terminal processing protease CtpA/Prc
MIILRLLPVLLLFNFQAGYPQESRKFSAAQLKEDLILVNQALQEAHPGLFRYLDKAGYAQTLRSIQESIKDSLTEQEFYTRLFPLISKIRCGHTKLLPSNYQEGKFLYPTEQAFPLQLYFENDNAYVLGDYGGSNRIKPGTAITHINGVSIAEIRKQLIPAITVDGWVETSINTTLNKHFNSLYAGFIGTSARYKLHYKEGKKGKNSYLEGISSSRILAAQEAATLPFELQWKEDVAVLVIRSFMADRAVHDFEKFADSVFLQLKEKSTNNLVIDLRNNEGGIEDWGGYLYSYLTDSGFRYYDRIEVARKDSFSFEQHAWLPPFYKQARAMILEKEGKFYWPLQAYLKEKPAQPNRFKGRVYLLLNGGSFSVSSEFAAMVKYHKRAIILGEESGGDGYVNNSGVFAILTLPASKLQLGIPLGSFYMNTKPVGGRGVLPDYTIQPTIQDLLKKKDPVMHHTIGIIAAMK